MLGPLRRIAITSFAVLVAGPGGSNPAAGQARGPAMIVSTTGIDVGFFTGLKANPDTNTRLAASIDNFGNAAYGVYLSGVTPPPVGFSGVISPNTFPPDTLAKTGDLTFRTDTEERFEYDSLSFRDSSGFGGGDSPFFSNIRNNDAGQTMFFASTVDADRLGYGGVWLDTNGGLVNLARTGDRVATRRGEHVIDRFYPDITPAVLNAFGQVAFSTHTDRGFFSILPSNLWLGSSSGLELIAEVGEPVPDGTAGETFELLSPATLNSWGEVLFAAQTRTPRDRSHGIWRGLPGLLNAVVRPGDPAASLPAGSQIDDIREHSPLNDRGEFAFSATYRLPGENFSRHSGLWVASPMGNRLIYSTGDDAPGLGGQYRFNSITGATLNSSADYKINSRGEVAFRSTLASNVQTSVFRQSLWRSGNNDPTLIAIEGDQAAGAETGVTFTRGPLSGELFDWVDLNDAGQVAFYSHLTGNGVDSRNDEGIWATDRSGNLRLIVREGDVWENVLGNPIAITDLSINTAPGGGQGGAFNDRGQLIYTAQFDDGTTSIIRSDLVAFLGVEGDYNADGVVDLADYTVWKSAFGDAVAAPGDGADGSFNGVVDAADFTIWRDNFAPMPPMAATVPEPSAGWLLVAAFGLVGRRRDW